MNCPFCQSESIKKIYKRHNFNVPNPFYQQEVGTLTIRFPFFKCEVCQEEFGSIETQNTIQSAVEEYVKKCFNIYQQEKQETIKYQEQEKNKNIERVSQFINEEISKMKKDLNKIFVESSEKLRISWFSVGLSIGLLSLIIPPLFKFNIILGIVFSVIFVILIAIGYICKVK